MNPVKRVEIITVSVEMQRIFELLDQVGVTGYTALPDAIGKGKRGFRSGDELTGVFKNSYILTACSEELLPSLLEALRPVLRSYGGICLVSDAQWMGQ